MRILTLLLVGLTLTATAQADSPRPSVLLRLKALEELIGDLRFLAEESGREREAKQVEGILKARTGPNGLEGVDVKKPIGFYANLKPSLTESETMLLLPIADEKTFVAFLETLGFKATKDKDGLYTLPAENIPVPLLFRVANGYLYGTVKLSDKMTLPAKLPAPDAILGTGASLVALTVNVDQIPEQIRKLGVSSSGLILGNLKDQDMPGATEKQKAVRDAVVDLLSRFVRGVLEDATSSELKVDVDRKAKDLSVSFHLDSKPGSWLAKELGGLTPAKSGAAGLVGKDSVMGGFLHLAMPAELRKVANAAIEEAIGKGMANLDANAKDLLTPLIEALKPTATSGTLDVGLDVRGPGKKGKYTMVAAMQIEKGKGIEKAVKDLLAKLPAKDKAAITTDVATEAGVNIHRVQQSKVEPGAQELFGDGPLYFAVREEGLVVAMGEDALDTIKEAVRGKVGAGQPLRVTLSAAKLAPLMQQKGAKEAAKKAFVEAGSDQVRLSVTSDARMEVKLSVRTAVLRFAGLLEQKP